MMKYIKKISFTAILLAVLVIGNMIPISIFTFISGDLTICNKSKYNISYIDSDFFSTPRINVGECVLVNKNRVLKKYMPFEVIVDVTGEDSVIFKKFLNPNKGDGKIGYFLDQTILVKNNRLVIDELLIVNQINSMKVVGTVGYEFQ